jgi:uncharacterized protein with GYD domain
MFYYLLQWTYKDPQIKAMVAVPQDRPAELNKIVAAFGGRVHQFFFCFGEYDGLAIVEFSDSESCAACILTLNAGGAASAVRTTVLITPDEAKRAMQRAHTTPTLYVPPVGYAAHG